MPQPRRATGENRRRAAQNRLEIFRQNLAAKDWGGGQSAGDEVHVEFPDDGNRPPCSHPDLRSLMWFRFVAKHFYMSRDYLAV
jgi:hypothetical protein